MNAQTLFKATAPPLRWDESGGIRIGKSRVTLDSLMASYQNGSTPEEIAVQYSTLDLADIYAVVTYYLNNRQQIDEYLEQRNREAYQIRQRLSERQNLTGLRERLLARRKP